MLYNLLSVDEAKMFVFEALLEKNSSICQCQLICQCQCTFTLVVSRWQHSVASRKALYMLAIKMASDRGTFVHCRRLFSLT